MSRWVLVALAGLLLACGPSSPTAMTAADLGRSDDGWRGIPLELERPRQLPAVWLEDLEGEPLRLDRIPDGRPSLLFFGYTSCPDVCPIHLATIASAMEQAGVRPSDVSVVFVSVDPVRDDAERIDEFLAAFDRRFVGVRGSTDQVQRALAALDLPGPTIESPDPRGGDLIGHPAQVIGFDAGGVARRVWPFGARRADWVNDLPRIIGEWSAATLPPGTEDG